MVDKCAHFLPCPGRSPLGTCAPAPAAPQLCTCCGSQSPVVGASLRQVYPHRGSHLSGPPAVSPASHVTSRHAAVQTESVSRSYSTSVAPRFPNTQLCKVFQPSGQVQPPRTSPALLNDPTCRCRHSPEPYPGLVPAARGTRRRKLAVSSGRKPEAATADLWLLRCTMEATDCRLLIHVQLLDAVHMLRAS